MFSVKPPREYHATSTLLAEIGRFQGTSTGRSRVRIGKTAEDHQSGAWQQRHAHKQKPIRCTSSHKMAAQDNRGLEFWQG